MAKKNRRLQATRSALRAAREKRGWTYLQASRELGVNRQQLKNLEGASCATRKTHGADIKLSTALALLRGYWPDLKLEDLAPGTPFSLEVHDPLDTP